MTSLYVDLLLSRLPLYELSILMLKLLFVELTERLALRNSKLSLVQFLLPNLKSLTLSRTEGTFVMKKGLTVTR